MANIPFTYGHRIRTSEAALQLALEPGEIGFNSADSSVWMRDYASGYHKLYGGTGTHAFGGPVTMNSTMDVYGLPGATNYERIRLSHSGSLGVVAVEKGGSGAYHNLEFQTGGLTRQVISSTGEHVFGDGNVNANPISGEESVPHIMELVNDATSKQCFRMSSYGTGGVIYENNVHFCRYRGTRASPANLVSGDFLMSTGYRGANDGGALSQSMAAFQVITIEDWVSDAHGCRFQWEVAETGSNYRTHAMELYAKKLKITWAVQACGYSAISESNPLSNVAFGVFGTVTGLAGTDQYSAIFQAVTTSAATATSAAVYAQVTTAAASYTTTAGIGINVGSASKGAGNTITTLYGIKVENQTAGNTNYAIHTGTGLVQFGDRLLTAASTTGRAGVNIPHGSAPSSPVNGDMWTTTAGLYIRINGATVGPLT